MMLLLLLAFSVSLGGALTSSSCSDDDLGFACINLDLCWQQMDFKSRAELAFLCRMFDEYGGLEPASSAGTPGRGFRLSSMATAPIIIVRAPRDQYIKPGMQAEFTCSAQNSDKLSILRSGTSPGESGAEGNEDVMKTWEVIYNVLHEDQGWITCFAIRRDGSYALARSYLTVTDVCENSNCIPPKVCNPDIYTGSYTCEIEGECPSECATEYAPVCGSDCSTYINECFMRKMACQKGQKDVYVASEGACTFTPQPIYFTENPQDGTYTEGWSTFSAEVAVPAGQSVQYLWYKGDEELGSGSELIIHLMTSHAGEWQVKAKSCNGRFEVSETFKVEVEERGGGGDGTGQCCKVYGDPHIITFDGKRYDYMGSCDYVIAEDIAGQWLIYGTYKACGDKTKQLSCIVAITVFFQNEMVQFLRMYRINYRGEEFSVPVETTTSIGEIRIERSDVKYMIYLGDTGVKIMWDGIATSEVCLPDKCSSGVQGMCGNADCNPDNEFAGFTGSSAFGNKWAIGKDCDLEPEDGALPTPRTRPCDYIPYETKLKYEARCNLILDMSVFSDCIYTAKIDRDIMFANCMFDMCSGLTLGGGCANRGDQRCDAEIEAKIAEAILKGMTRAAAEEKYVKKVVLDPACIMGYNLVMQCAEAGVNVDDSWIGMAECPSKEERRNTVICPYS